MKRYAVHAGTGHGCSDPIKAYLKDLKMIEPLSREEECDLFVRYKKSGDRKAYERIVESHLRLVVRLARNYLNRGVNFMDLVEEGNLGLLHAIEKFEVERGFRFATYGSWWIKQNIERAIMNQSRHIRLPVHVIKQLTSFLNADRKIPGKSSEKPATTEEIAKHFNVEVDDVQKIMSYKLDTMSLDAAVYEDSDVSWSDSVADENAHDPCDMVGDASTAHILKDWLERLDELDHAVIVSRYGLLGNAPETLEKVGEKMGLTRERVRQIQMRALGRLRRFMNFSGVKASEMLMSNGHNVLLDYSKDAQQ